MAFPTIPTAGAGRLLSVLNTVGGATKTSPSLSSLTKNAGDLLIAICIIYDGNSTNAEFSGWGGGFTEFGDFAGTATMGIGVAYKWSTGSETGTFTVTTADTSANDSAFFLLSIPGAHASTPPEAGSFATGTGAANPAAFNPAGWDAEDTLWIAVGGSGETSGTGSYTGLASAPTNYTNYADSGISADVVGGVEGAVAFRQLNAASEDVGAFTGDTSNARDSALVIAVRPAAPEEHFGTVVATGGGVSVNIGVKGGRSTQIATAGGVATVSGVKQGLVVVVGTGGGVATTTAFSAHTAVFSGTGSGVAAIQQATARAGAAIGTGGGVGTTVGQKASVTTVSGTGAGVGTIASQKQALVSIGATGGGEGAPQGSGAHSGSLVGTGGGSATQTQTTARATIVTATASGQGVVQSLKQALQQVTATASGTAQTTQTTTRVTTVTATGGGVATITYLVGGGGEQHFGAVTATGAGEAFLTTLAGRYVVIQATGGGVGTTLGTASRATTVQATGGGAATTQQTTARTLTVVITGGGEATITYEHGGSPRDVGVTGGGTATVTYEIHPSHAANLLIIEALADNDGDVIQAGDDLLQLAVKRRQMPRAGDPVRAELGRDASTGIVVEACVALGVTGQVLDTLREVTHV